MTYRKVGGLHFVRVGRYGASFYVSRPKTSSCKELVVYEPKRTHPRAVWFDKVDLYMFITCIVLGQLAAYLWG
jgi:hypothetical protein